MIIKTGRFGSLEVADEEIIQIPLGILGFPEFTRFCLVDPGDETLILWLQSLDNPDLAIPVLEPKIFKPEYSVRLSAAELRELKLVHIQNSAVFTLLTIGDEITEMTANLRAPIVVNLKQQLARQVVLQENEYSLRHPMFKELRQHLLTMSSNSGKGADGAPNRTAGAVTIGDIPPSLTVRALA